MTLKPEAGFSLASGMFNHRNGKGTQFRTD